MTTDRPDLSDIPSAPQDCDPLQAAYPNAETLKLLALRRSTLAREMSEPGPSEEELDALIRISARVPDHGKLGPWRFLIFRGPAREKFGQHLAEIFAGQHTGAEESHIEFERNRFLRAPTVVAVISKTIPHPKAPEWEQILSSGAVCQNFLIAASAMGYAAQWITEWYGYDPQVHQVMGMEDNERVAGFIYLGTATTDPEERRRASLAERIANWS